MPIDAVQVFGRFFALPKAGTRNLAEASLVKQVSSIATIPRLADPADAALLELQQLCSKLSPASVQKVLGVVRAELAAPSAVHPQAAELVLPPKETVEELLPEPRTSFVVNDPFDDESETSTGASSAAGAVEQERRSRQASVKETADANSATAAAESSSPGGGGGSVLPGSFSRMSKEEKEQKERARSVSREARQQKEEEERIAAAERRRDAALKRKAEAEKRAKERETPPASSPAAAAPVQIAPVTAQSEEKEVATPQQVQMTLPKMEDLMDAAGKLAFSRSSSGRRSSNVSSSTAAGPLTSWSRGRSMSRDGTPEAVDAAAHFTQTEWKSVLIALQRTECASDEMIACTFASDEQVMWQPSLR